jgi:hypothetical protein
MTLAGALAPESPTVVWATTVILYLLHRLLGGLGLRAGPRHRYPALGTTATVTLTASR